MQWLGLGVWDRCILAYIYIYAKMRIISRQHSAYYLHAKTAYHMHAKVSSTHNTDSEILKRL